MYNSLRNVDDIFPFLNIGPLQYIYTSAIEIYECDSTRKNIENIKKLKYVVNKSTYLFIFPDTVETEEIRAVLTDTSDQIVNTLCASALMTIVETE
jgi:hypothetical protein